MLPTLATRVATVWRLPRAATSCVPLLRASLPSTFLRTVTSTASSLSRAHQASPHHHDVGASATHASTESEGEGEGEGTLVFDLPFIVVNRDRIEGYEVVKELGMVSSADVRSKNIILDVIVAFQGYAWRGRGVRPPCLPHHRVIW